MKRKSAKTHLGGVDLGSAALRHSLLFSFWDGIFANAMVALNDTFGTAAALRLHAPNWAIPLLTSLPLLLGATGQFILPHLTSPEKGRKHYVLWGVRLQALGVFLCGWSGFLPGAIAAYAFVALFALAGIFGSTVAGYWIAWIGDMVPLAIRGRHFAWRNVFFAWSNLSCSLVAGIVARHYDTLTAPWLLFAGIFSVAATFRFLSSLSMARQEEVLVQEEKPTYSVLDMHLFQPPRGLTAFALSTALFQGVANLASPFFNVWYLGDLHFSYLSLAIATASTVLGSILALRFWGRLADRKGNLWVLRLSALLIGFIPLPYLFLHQPAYLWVVNVFGGAVWAGYNLANFNCILAATGKHRQSQAIAFVALITGISMTFFGVLGGWLSEHLPILFTWRLQSMFLLSGLLRFAFWLLFISRLRLPSKA